jgi:sec-independent protein translocase protein TatB
VFNVGLGEIVAIVLVTLLLFGPERLPEMARQAGRWLGRLRLTTQDALDQLKDETDLKDLNLPDLRIGSLRSQARDYVRELMDVEGQMAELEREREQLKAALAGEQNGDGAKDGRDGRDGAAEGGQASTADLGPPPVDPEAT